MTVITKPKPRGFGAKYIVRKRTMESYVSEYGPKMKFGKWIIVCKRDTQEKAAEEMLKVTGDFDVAIWHQGQRITKKR